MAMPLSSSTSPTTANRCRLLEGRRRRKRVFYPVKARRRLSSTMGRIGPHGRIWTSTKAVTPAPFHSICGYIPVCTLEVLHPPPVPAVRLVQDTATPDDDGKPAGIPDFTQVPPFYPRELQNVHSAKSGQRISATKDGQKYSHYNRARLQASATKDGSYRVRMTHRSRRSARHSHPPQNPPHTTSGRG